MYIPFQGVNPQIILTLDPSVNPSLTPGLWGVNPLTPHKGQGFLGVGVLKVPLQKPWGNPSCSLVDPDQLQLVFQSPVRSSLCCLFWCNQTWTGFFIFSKLGNWTKTGVDQLPNFICENATGCNQCDAASPTTSKWYFVHPSIQPLFSL